MRHLWKYFLLPTLFIFVALPLTFLVTTHSYAALPDQLDAQETFIRGTVVQVLQEGLHTAYGVKSYQERLVVTLLEGKAKGTTVTIGYETDGTFGINQRIGKGDAIVVDSKTGTDGKTIYTVYEPYRLTLLWWVLAGFIVFIIAIARWKGVGALIGLTISLATILIYIVPQILQGRDPLTVCVTGAIFILLITTYIAHGISLKTTVAVVGTGISLALSAGLAILIVQIGHLTGLGNEDIYNIQLGTTHPINPQGLLLGSILIGTLGALNDITTTQAITIFSFVKENPTQHFLHLFKKSMHIGQEHIASLVNTLVLAYAGTSLAVFIFFALNPVKLPWWIILNNETTMEEIIRTVVGSTGLILAVPITTLLATVVALYGRNIIETIWWNITGE